MDHDDHGPDGHGIDKQKQCSTFWFSAAPHHAMTIQQRHATAPKAAAVGQVQPHGMPLLIEPGTLIYLVTSAFVSFSLRSVSCVKTRTC